MIINDDKIKTIAIAVLTIFSIATSGLNAQDKTTFSIETDPSTFVFKGYALHLRIKPENSKQLVIGVGTYALDLPSLMVDINPKNKGRGGM